MTELVERAADFVRSALLKDLRLETNVKAGALAQEPRSQQRRVVGMGRDVFCGFLEFSQGDCGGAGYFGRHGVSSRIQACSRTESIKNRRNRASSPQSRGIGWVFVPPCSGSSAQ